MARAALPPYHPFRPPPEATFAMGAMAWPLHAAANALLLAVATLFGRRSSAVFGTLGL